MHGPPLLLVEALATRNDSGLGRLARLVVDGLAGLRGEAEIRVLLPRGGAYRPGGHCRAIPVSPRPFRLWCQTAFPLLIARHRPDAVLCLGQTLPRWRPSARYALMIADAGPLEDLGHATSSHDAYNRRWLATVPPQADRILTIGRFSKARLETLLRLPPEKVHVVKPILRPAAPRAPRAPRLAPAGPYLLTVGNVEPRKNIPGLIAAYARFRSRHADAPPLVVAGHRAWGIAEAEAAARAHGVSAQVRFTGFVDEAEREALIAHCTLYVSASLYEGWGLPLFEALALGRPAIYHRGTSQEEFASGFALSADCSDPESLAAALGALWSDASRRAALEAALAAGFGGVMDYDLEGALRDALLPLLRRS